MSQLTSLSIISLFNNHQLLMCNAVFIYEEEL